MAHRKNKFDVEDSFFEELIVTKVTKQIPASNIPINPDNKIFVKDGHRVARVEFYI
jgi:hypothetical protein